MNREQAIDAIALYMGVTADTARERLDDDENWRREFKAMTGKDYAPTVGSLCVGGPLDGQRVNAALDRFCTLGELSPSRNFAHWPVTEPAKGGAVPMYAYTRVPLVDRVASLYGRFVYVHGEMSPDALERAFVKSLELTNIKY